MIEFRALFNLQKSCSSALLSHEKLQWGAKGWPSSTASNQPCGMCFEPFTPTKDEQLLRVQRAHPFVTIERRLPLPNQRTFVAGRVIVNRSEERSVGKECVSRCR